MVQQKSRKKRRTSSAPLIFLICVLSVILVMVILLALYLDSSKPEPTTPPDTTQTEPLGGWKEENGVQVYHNPDGTLATGWLELDTGRYYLDSSGAMQTGWLTWQNQRYYFDADGVMHTGWLELSNKRYYLDDAGMLQTGWLELADGRYYLDDTGAAVSGWQTVEEQEYYFKETGAMARGIVEIEGVKHFFTSSGKPIILVNPWNFIPEGYDPVLKELPRELGEDHKVVEGECYDQLVIMLEACNAAMKEQFKGTTGKMPQAYVISSHRTHEYQSNAYQNKINRVMNEDPSLTREEAEKIAAQVVAFPGTSEHQLGLAVDIIDTQLWKLEEEQENLPAQQWLMAHSWEYGFILRYPKEKTDSTGIIYEPWHYRYVGMDVAKEIFESGKTLEQYLESLS